MIDSKSVVVIALLTLGLGFYLGKQASSVSETTTQEQDTTKKDVVTIIKEVTRPDGSKETTTTVTDHTKETENKQSSATVIVPVVAMNKASVSVLSSSFKDVDSYTLSYERRLAGPIWVGANYNTKQIYGLSIGMEF